jgi:hypothetical protein
MRTALLTILLGITTSPAPPAALRATLQPVRPDQYRIPIGTIMAVRLRTPIDSSANHANDQVDAVLLEPFTQNGVELIPSGSVFHGSLVRVEAASRKAPRGLVSIAFAVVQHAETGSRAPCRTRAITIEAPEPPAGAGKPRASRRQPIDIVLPAGSPLLLTLDEPLVVAIPKAADLRATRR